MSDLFPEGWPEPPMAGDEVSAVLGALERQRATLAWKTSGLDADGMRATLPPSAVTLGGLLKHLALIEDHTFGAKLRGEPLGAAWDDADLDADPDWEWHSAAGDTPEELRARWEAAVQRSRRRVAEALADGGLDHRAALVTRSGAQPNLRRLVMDLIEEYARHVGHADLVRESVDGLVGEDPPG
jgi:hypothetical protein